MMSRKIVLTFLLAMFLALACIAQEVGAFNEIPGFEFYGKGKLKGISLKNSSRADVIAAFGNDCDYKVCEYDENWKLTVLYLEDYVRQTRYDRKYEYALKPSQEFIEKAWILMFEPKKNISLNDFSFPAIFKRSSRIEGHSGLQFLDYSSENRLTYSIIDEDYAKGNLIGIYYKLSESEEEEMFVVVGMKDKVDE